MLALVVAAPPPASGERAGEHQLYERLFPRVPEGRQLTLNQQIADQLTLLGNTIGYHASQLSNEMVALAFDGRRRRAYVRIAGGSDRFLNFSLASQIHFTQGLARIHARVNLTVAGRAIAFRLPEVEMVPASYRGERGVEVRVPLFKRSF